VWHLRWRLRQEEEEEEKEEENKDKKILEEIWILRELITNQQCYDEEIPRNIKEADKSNSWKYWRQATKEELMWNNGKT